MAEQSCTVIGRFGGVFDTYLYLFELRRVLSDRRADVEFASSARIMAATEVIGLDMDAMR